MLNNLILWSKKNFSQLPWRTKRTLYHTFVSEIMLQQTTVGAVIPRFKKFIKKFPNLKALSCSEESDVMLYWQGLGYYRRAKNLRLGAIDLKTNYKSQFPDNLKSLIKIPGIGEYTASAILSIGKDQSFIAVDANIERVLSRLYKINLPKGLLLKKDIRQKIESKKYLKDFYKHSPREINEALMDLGRTICQQNKAQCEVCPISKDCQSFKSQINPLQYPPRDKKKKSKKFELVLARIVFSKNKKVFLVKRTKGQWLEGQWELPSFVIKTNDKSFFNASKSPQYEKNKIQLGSLKEIGQFQSAITKYKINNIVFSSYKNINLSGKYFDPRNNEALHFSSATLKALKFIGQSIKK